MLQLIQQLREEHKTVYEKVERLRALWRALEKETPGLREEIRKELKGLEEFLHAHHGTEEDVLFPQLLTLPTPVNNGGPRCNIYMTDHVVSPALRTAEERAQSYQVSVDRESPRRGKILELQRNGSFLAIPMEEHEAGFLHVKILTSLLDKSDTHWSDLAITLHAYLSLIEGHAKKEDDCLFPQVEDIIN